MIMYNIVLPTLLLFFIASRNRPKSKVILYCTVILLLFFATFKGINVGSDSYEYWDTFTHIHNYLNDEKYSGLQKGFIWFTYGINKFGGYTLYLFICYLICLFGYSYYFQKCSRNTALSFLMFFMLAYYIASLNIMRQYMAMGLYVVGLTFLSQGKKNYFILFTILASLFHYTAIVFLPLVFIDKISTLFSKAPIVLCLVLLSFILGFLYKDTMFNILSMMSGDYYSEGYLNWIASNFELERNLISNIGLNVFFCVTYLLSNNKQSVFIIIWALGLILCNMFGSMDQANRIFLYLNMGILIAVPETLYSLTNKLYKYGYLIFTMIYLFVIWFYLRETNGVTPYSFR